MHVAYPSVVVVIGKDTLQSQCYGHVVSHLVGGSQREAEAVLTALHVGIHLVATEGEVASGLQSQYAGHLGHCLCDACVDLLVYLCRIECLEGAKAILELTLAAAASQGKRCVEAPALPVVAQLEAGNDGSICFSLEPMRLLAGSGCIVCKEREGCGDVSALLGVLCIERDVEAGSQKGSTCRVEIESCDVDDSVL